MEQQEIKGEDYSVKYDPDSFTILFKGELSLGGPADYAPIVDLMNQVVDGQPSILTLNLRELEFLNSSGISILSRFVINMRKNSSLTIVVKGTHDVPWQGKSLKNLQRLLPTLQLEMDPAA